MSIGCHQSKLVRSSCSSLGEPIREFIVPCGDIHIEARRTCCCQEDLNLLAFSSSFHWKRNGPSSSLPRFRPDPPSRTNTPRPRPSHTRETFHARQTHRARAWMLEKRMCNNPGTGMASPASKQVNGHVPDKGSKWLPF